MKRKRFIKLLMGEYTMTRNQANTMAATARSQWKQYKPALYDYEQTVQMFANHFMIPVSALKKPEKGSAKAHRRYLKALKAAAAAMRGGAGNA